MEEEIKKLNKQISQTSNEDEKLRLKDIVDYMRKVEMAVVISEDADEEKKFAAEGLS
jgi:type I restriction enzyme R subunit